MNAERNFSARAMRRLPSLSGLAALALLAGCSVVSPGGVIYSLTNWIGPLFGGMPVVRFVHHALTWTFLIFIPIHVYLAVRADVLHKESTVSSIISGQRTVRADVEFVDD